MVIDHASTRRSLGPLARSVDRLAQWWTQAPQEERFNLIRASVNGDREAPPLKTLQIAIYLAEAESGEVG